MKPSYLKRTIRRAAEQRAAKKAAAQAEPFSDWLARQPGSTRRGVARGNFELPARFQATVKEMWQGKPQELVVEECGEMWQEECDCHLDECTKDNCPCFCHDKE